MFKILIVEDSDLYLKVEKKIFDNPIMYDMITVKSIKEAKKSLDEWSFDVILLDINLEDGLGTAVVDYARGEKKDNKTYIVAVISEVYEELIVKLYTKGVDYYIKKPFSPSILKATIDRIMARLEI